MMTRHFTKEPVRLLIAGAMTAVLVGCGGGGGGDGGGFGDSNLDGIEDADLDGDGIVDDVNGDGIVDVDLNDDGILDVDLNENGIADEDEDDSAGDPNALSCPFGGEDATSSDDQWNNNCVLRSGVTSYYTRGLQRILYCLGFDEGTTRIGDFADAQFGPTTERAVRAFQNDQELTVDGIVGSQTWQALRDTLVALEETQNNLDEMDVSYAIDDAVDDPACGDQVQFYREYDANDQFTSWKIANNAGEAQRVEFSVRNPFQ